MHSHFPRRDPGDCPICGTPHCSCGGGVVVEVVQLPNRDAAGAQVQSDAPAPAALGDGSDRRPFSTATYRGRYKRRPT